MKHSIETARDSDAAEWNEFVVRQPGWTHFHQFGWSRVIQEVFSHRCDYLVARDSGRIAGVLPLVRVRSLVFGDFMVSMPFLNYGGPLGDTTVQRELVEHARQLAGSRSVDLLEIRSRAKMDVDLTPSLRKITVLLDLPSGSPASLFSALDSKLRSQIRRPTKDGVVVRFGSDLCEHFFRVFSRNMRDLGTPTMPKKFFERASTEFGDSMWFGVAYLGEIPVAAGCGFRWNDEFEMTWASSLREYSRSAPNMLLYWSFIERATTEGLKVFNFGRCSPGSGPHRFKLQWNSREEQLYWYQHGRRGTEATPSPNGKFSFGPRIWRMLPEKLATAIGPQIVRYIP